MFEQIEREFKNSSKERAFNKFYWLNAIFIFIIASILSMIDERFHLIRYYFIFGWIIIIVIAYFIYDYSKTIKKIKVKKDESILSKISLYVNYNEKEHINNLINILSKYNFRTKNDLKLAIDYYNSKQPIEVESSFLAWIVSTALTISSFIEIAYDSETKTLDYQKISIILGSTIGYMICIFIPILFLKMIINSVILPKKKIQSQLSEDLSYIYLNFNKYISKLAKKSNAIK